MAGQQHCFVKADYSLSPVELLHHVARHLDYSGVARISIYEDPPKAELHFANAENNDGFLFRLLTKFKSAVSGSKTEQIFSISMSDIGETGKYFKVFYELENQSDPDLNTSLVEEIFKPISDVTLHWPVD